MLHSVCMLVLLFLRCEAETLEKIEIVPKIPNFVEYGNNQICLLDSNTYKENLKNFTLWAHKLLDSSSKSTFGLLQGNSYHLGDYEQCINIVAPFPTQYCLISLTINLPIGNATTSYSKSHLPYGSYLSNFQNPYHSRIQQINNIRIALCLPVSCLAQDIEYSLTEHLRNTKKPFEAEGVTYAVALSEHSCTSKSKPKEFGKLEIVFCAFSAMLLSLVIFGTLQGYSRTTAIIKRTDEVNFRSTFWWSFSAITSFKGLFHPHENSVETQIFDGVRSVTLLVVVVADKLGCMAISPWINPNRIDKLANTKTGYLLEKLDLTVTTFFVMSGLMLSYGISKKLKSVKISPFLLIFLRHVRLTPLNAYVCFFTMTMLNFCGSGPLWSSNVQPLIDNCRKTMWMNVLYINNLATTPELYCNPLSWFISCDFQLFVVGTFIMFIIRWKKRLGYAILGFYFFLSIITPFALTLVYKITPISWIYFNDHTTILFVMPYDHASSYIVGIFGGILYSHFKSNDIKISKVRTYSTIATSSFCMVCVLGYLPTFYHGYENYSTIEIALYNSLHRFVWSASLLGIFVVTSFGSATSLRRGLSSTFWIPISKLSYGIFLIHTIQYLISDSNIRTVIYATWFYAVNAFVADIIIIILVSLLLYICVEVPIIILLKYIFLPNLYLIQVAKQTVKEEVESEVQAYLHLRNNLREDTNEN